jgi:hypothetical protein
MGKNFRSWPLVATGKDGPRDHGDVSTSLSYDKSRNALGISFSCMSGWEREYAYTITRWMAIKIGKRRCSFKGDEKSLKIAQPAPFIVYDGSEFWPILIVNSIEDISKLPKEWKWCAADALGLRSDPSRYMFFVWLEAEESLGPLKLAKYMVDQLKIKRPKPGSGDTFDQFVEKRNRLQYNYAKDHVTHWDGIIRKEIERLDALWQAQ